MIHHRIRFFGWVCKITGKAVHTNPLSEVYKFLNCKVSQRQETNQILFAITKSSSCCEMTIKNCWCYMAQRSWVTQFSRWAFLVRLATQRTWSQIAYEQFPINVNYKGFWTTCQSVSTSNLSLKVVESLCSCFILFGHHQQCTNTAPELGREPETNDS